VCGAISLDVRLSRRIEMFSMCSGLPSTGGAVRGTKKSLRNSEIQGAQATFISVSPFLRFDMSR
jgi:hypothetical protein